MKKIIGIIKPFALKQKLFVYEDGQPLDQLEVSFEKLQIYESLIQLSEKYELDQVDLTGPKAYTNRLKEYCDEQQILKYGKNKLTINII